MIMSSNGNKCQWRSFDVFFDLFLNKRLSTQSKLRWFETPSRSLWRHCNVIVLYKLSLGHNKSTGNHWFNHAWNIRAGRTHIWCCYLVDNQWNVVQIYTILFMGVLCTEYCGIWIDYQIHRNGWTVKSVSCCINFNATHISDFAAIQKVRGCCFIGLDNSSGLVHWAITS